MSRNGGGGDVPACSRRGRDTAGQGLRRAGGSARRGGGRAARLRAGAQAHAKRSQAQGQADANDALAASLRERNQKLIAASTLIQNLPALVEAAARGLAGANLTVLNGTQGVNEVVAGLVGQGPVAPRPAEEVGRDRPAGKHERHRPDGSGQDRVTPDRAR